MGNSEKDAFSIFCNSDVSTLKQSQYQLGGLVPLHLALEAEAQDATGTPWRGTT